MSNHLLDLGDAAFEFFTIAVEQFIHTGDRRGLDIMREFHTAGIEKMPESKINEIITWILNEEGRLLGDGRATE